MQRRVLPIALLATASSCWDDAMTPSIGDGAVRADRTEALATDSLPLSLAVYERMMLALATCEIRERSIDYHCEAETRFREARSNQGNILSKLGGGLSALGQRHLEHHSPAVRLYAAGLLGASYGAGSEATKVVLARAPREEHPAVLAAMVDAVGSQMKANPAVTKLVMKMAGHGDPTVRKVSVTWLTSAWSDGVKGSLEKAMKMVQNDVDPKVRQHACRRLGERGDERTLRIFKRFTDDKTANKDPDLYAHCMEGLAEMFLRWPHPNRASKKGFDLFLKRLGTKTCNDTKPPWRVISTLAYAVEDGDAQRAPWFLKEKKKLIANLGRVAVCEQASWLARTGAVQAMAKLGAPRPVFERLMKKVAKDEGKGKSPVVAAIEKVL